MKHFGVKETARDSDSEFSEIGENEVDYTLTDSDTNNTSADVSNICFFLIPSIKTGCHTKVFFRELSWFKFKGSLSIYPSANLILFLSVCQSNSLSVCLILFLSVCQSNSLSVCLILFLSSCLSILVFSCFSVNFILFWFVYQPHSPSICLLECISHSLLTFLSNSFILLCLSVCQSIGGSVFMVETLVFGIVVSEFELQSRYNV